MPKYIFLFIIVVIWFLLGMIIVATGIYPLILPILFPIVMSLGFNPIWFGVITIKLSEIAAITPPVGLNVYTLKGVAGKGVTLEDIYAGIWPFVACDLVVLLILTIFPGICLFLPNLFFGN